MKKTFLLIFVVMVFAACRNEKEQQTETAPPIDHEQAVHPEDTGEMDNIHSDQDDNGG